MRSYKRYIAFQKGTIPLIFSIPHGGTIKLKDIQKRKSGIIGIDKGTIQLGKEIARNIELKIKKRNKLSAKCYYVISKIHRSRIDLNRPPKKAFNKHLKVASKLYNLYHNKLFDYISDSITCHGSALLLDLHGFESYKRPDGFRDVDVILGTNNLKSLFNHSVRKKNWNKNIRGNIIKKCLTFEIPIAPGRPRREEYVLKGGYITKKYGASKIEHSKSLQIEFSERIRMLDTDLRKNVIETLTEALYEELSKRILKNKKKIRKDI
jgi:N-formylglutamate amidohydrolase